MIILAPFTLWEASTGNVPVWNWETAGWIALLALVASFGAYQVYAYVQRVLGAGRSSLLMYLVPIYNAVLAWALLGETPQPLSLDRRGAGSARHDVGDREG
ncbi:EamA family transporter [Pacificispira sp.]|uniref:EamA family transporter n=1 Tax=Pacificispira sp. TaxID=2888761 RepID=UPI003B52E10B